MKPPIIESVFAIGVIVVVVIWGAFRYFIERLQLFTHAVGVIFLKETDIFRF